MRTLLLSLCAALWTATVLAPAAVLADARTPDPTSPEGLVRSALKSEFDGRAGDRKSYLEEALRSDPDFAPARWQSGYVRLHNRWVHVDEIPSHVRRDTELAAYRAKRGRMDDSIEDHRALAKWCRANDLGDEARTHWIAVLGFDPNDRDAIRALRLQVRRGRLLTREQFERETSRLAQERRARDYWRPQVVAWRRAIEHGTWEDRSNAVAQLRALSDPGAVGPLESQFALKGESAKVVELNLLLVETIGRIPQAEATNALVRRSVVADAPAVRSEAIEQLKQRPLHTFVPTLIAAASNSVMTRYQDFVRRNGGIANEHRLLQEGNGADDSVVFVLNTIGLGLTSQAASALSNDGYIVALRKGSLKNRIQTVLERTTGLANLDDPATWEKRWNDYNGWDTPAYRVEVIAPRRSFSCFPAGTPVLTMTGATPIEEIMVGDRVLSKDPATGELTYKSVQRTTQRRAAPLVEISFGAQALRTTPGHPFWVSGKGWQVAKHLERGDRLHGIDGAVTVEMVEELPATDVHNLVVNDYHNYFVGDQRLLVHDNSPLEATSSLLPGLAAEVAAKSR